ncbi:MAG: hypothetical protein JNM94_18340 [Phycisphaerae bacterium]|nr:hypothetical protein [Phycisphaerae bacterium]
MATAPPDERSETSASDSRLEKDSTDAHTSSSFDVAAGAPTAPLDDVQTEDHENADLLSLEQLAVEEIGAMLNSAAASAQATASALTGATELPNVDDLLSDLFGAAPAETSSAAAAEDPTPAPLAEPVASVPSEPEVGTAPETMAEPMADAPEPTPEPTPDVAAPTEAPSEAQPEAQPEAPPEAPIAADAPSESEASAERAPEAVAEAPSEPEAATSSDPEPAPQPPPDAAPEPVAHAAPDVAAVAAAAAVVAEPKPHVGTRGAALINSLLQPVFKPLRAISAPVLKLPPTVRTLVGLFGLTLLPWAPAIWWLGSSVVAADRVRPLSETELVALTESLRTPSAASGGHGEKKDAGGHGGGEKKAESHGAAKDEKPKEKAKEKPKEKAKEPAKKAESHH